MLQRRATAARPYPGMKLRRLIGAACVCVVVAGCSGGLLGAGAKSYTLQIKPKQGQTFNYTMNMTGAQNMSADFTMTADKIENGNVTFRCKFANMTMNGQAAPPAISAMMSNMTVVQTMDKTGKQISQTVEGLPNGMQAPSQGSIATATLPDHPVKVGDTWTGKAQNTTATYKLVSVDDENGKQVAHIDVTIGSTTLLKPDGPAKLSLDVDTGMPIEQTMSGTTNGQKMSVSMKRTN